MYAQKKLGHEEGKKKVGPAKTPPKGETEYSLPSRKTHCTVGEMVKKGFRRNRTVGAAGGGGIAWNPIRA